MSQEILNSVSQKWKNLSCNTINATFGNFTSSIDQGTVTSVVITPENPNIGQLVNGVLLFSVGSSVSNFPSGAVIDSWLTENSGITDLSGYKFQVLVINSTSAAITINLGLGCQIGGFTTFTISPSNATTGTMQKYVIFQNTGPGLYSVYI